MAAVKFDEVVIATSNPGKLREFKSILDGLSIQIKSINSYPGVTLPEEGGDYEENAILKATSVCKVAGCPTLADDSGLEVDALDGAPGPFSARYGGIGLQDSDRISHLLAALANASDTKRRARFVCVASLVIPGGLVVTKTGYCEGVILSEPRGEGGFGYDSIFGIGEGDRSMAELSEFEKNRISHRAQALEALLPEVKRYIHV